MAEATCRWTRRGGRGPMEGPKSKLEEKQSEQDIISKFKHESLSLESRYRRCLR